ncbi:hypothetical protein AMS68_004807 [Peltaster fructicola]|uniref:F-box domain-containing protein n=1 Tax=Peltaster fructicola TaxID=286661 RepID=A0A6H0XXZ4_9PEZI|nr:hypothetical protein AMS68_004807 [Peltaster fructicola]
MALDQQRNWDISMAENLERIQLNAKRDREKTQARLRTEEQPLVPPFVPRPFQGPPIYLPDEILTQILSFVVQHNDSQKTLAACCLLSHQWYNVAVPYLYESPRLYGKNFDPFARTICPSINLHVRKSPLSSLVHNLDMGGLVHQGSKVPCSVLEAEVPGSLTRLGIAATAGSPQIGFGSYEGVAPIRWPPQLQAIVLSGGIDARFLAGVASYPDTLRSMTIEHCPLAKSYLVINFIVNSLRKLPLLDTLKISNMPRFSACALDDLLHILPNIKRLSVSVDYISPAFFDEGSGRRYVLDDAQQEDESSLPRQLRHDKLHTLELTNSSNPSIEEKITPIDVLIAVDDDVLPALRVVRVAKSLHWRSGDTMLDVDALTDALQSRNAADWENRAGEYQTMPVEQWKATKPLQAAGVWFIDG